LPLLSLAVRVRAGASCAEAAGAARSEQAAVNSCAPAVKPTMAFHWKRFRSFH